MRLVSRTEVDDERWNAAVRLSAHPLPYALAGYMDAVSPGWEGLITEDYSLVVPLPVVRTLGLRRLIQPYYCQQLGAFSRTPVSRSQLLTIVQLLNKRYLTAHYKFNASSGDYEILQPVANQVLPLQKSYDELHYGFQSSVARNIRHAVKDGVSVRATIISDKHLSFYLSLMRSIGQRIHRMHEQRFRNLCRWLHEQKMLQVYEARSCEDELLAIQLLVHFANRLILLANACSTKGRKQNAISAIFNTVIATHAESGLLLDFEGSEVPGIAQFNHSFGATDEVYYRWQKTCMGRV